MPAPRADDQPLRRDRTTVPENRRSGVLCRVPSIGRSLDGRMVSKHLSTPTLRLRPLRMDDEAVATAAPTKSSKLTTSCSVCCLPRTCRGPTTCRRSKLISGAAPPDWVAATFLVAEEGRHRRPVIDSPFAQRVPRPRGRSHRVRHPSHVPAPRARHCDPVTEPGCRASARHHRCSRDLRRRQRRFGLGDRALRWGTRRHHRTRERRELPSAATGSAEHRMPCMRM